MQASQIFATGHLGLARAACLLGGAVWGAYWIPLRILDASGFSGVLATGVIHVIPTLMLVPLMFIRRSSFHRGGIPLQATGAAMALAILLYSTAFLYTDVVRAVLLYYLTPVWGTLFARLWLAEKISLDRVFGIVLGIAGMLIIFNIDQGIPLPKNPGDWMALCSGVVWALAATLTRRFPGQHAVDVVSSWFVWVSGLAIVAMFCLPGAVSIPPAEAYRSVLPWLVPLALLVVLPVYLAITWGLPQLNPGTSGLLFMTEISVGTLTAAWLTTEIIGPREIAGIILISLAGLSEVLLPVLRNALRRPKAS
jgi:drug/metabolite transporter (DMT)-like permease